MRILRALLAFLLLALPAQAVQQLVGYSSTGDLSSLPANVPNGTIVYVAGATNAFYVKSAGTWGGLSIAATTALDLTCSGCVSDSELVSNYSGIGACGANTWASTLNDNAAPTCTQPAFSSLSGIATVAQGGTGATTAAAAMMFGNNTASTAAPDFQGTGWLGGGSPTLTVGGLYGNKLGGVKFKQSTNSSVILYVPASPTLMSDVLFALPTADGTTGQPLKTDGAGTLSFGVLGVAGGGTGRATLTAHGVLVGEGTSPVALVTAPASNLYVLQSVSGADPTWTNNVTVSTVIAGNVTPSITVGTASSVDGGVAFKNGSGAHVVTLRAPASDPASDLTFVLPAAAAGASGQAMTATTAGTLSLGVLGVVGGGTGLATTTQGAIITGGSGTGNMVQLADVATGSVLVSGGTSTIPAWSTGPSISTITTSGLATLGTLKVGGGGTISKIFTGSATLDFTSTATATCGTDLGITVTGVAVGDPVVVSPIQASVMGLGGIFFNAWVSSANNVTVRFCNLSGAARDPVSATYTVVVFH